MRSRSGFVYLLALVVVLVTASVAVAMAAGAGLRLRADDDVSARAQCRAAAMGMLRAVVNDLSVSQAAGGTPGLVTVVPSGERIGACEVVLLGRDPTGAKAVFDLIPEAARIDVNQAPIDVLAALPGMNTQIAAAIKDWRDVDDVVDPAGGAERSDTAYHAAIVPYAPRNAPFEGLDELRMVRGVTDALWFGEDANRNGRLDPGEDANGNGRLDPGLRDVLTIDSREPAGTTTVTNVGSLLRQLFPSSRVASMTPVIAGVTDRLTLLERLVQRNLVNDDEAAEIYRNTTDNRRGRLGLLDAWSCREDVLASVVGSELAAQVIAARPSTLPSGPAWLARLPGVSIWGQRLTSGSWQFRADILAVRIDGAGWARLDALIDCSTATPRVASIRPAEHDGWPLPWVTPEMIRKNLGSQDPAAFLASGQP